MLRIVVVIVSLLYRLKQKQPISFGPGLLKIYSLCQKGGYFSLKKNVSFHKEVTCYRGWASLEWRRGIYLTLAIHWILALSSLEQCDKSNSKKEMLSPICKSNASVIKRPKDFPVSCRSSALCCTHLYKAFNRSI